MNLLVLGFCDFFTSSDMMMSNMTDNTENSNYFRQSCFHLLIILDIFVTFKV